MHWIGTGNLKTRPRPYPAPEPSKGEIENAAESYISTKTERGKPMPEAPLPGWGESRENLRRFMEEGTLELNFKGPIGIRQVKRVGNGEKDFPTQHAGYKGREHRWENTGKESSCLEASVCV